MALEILPQALYSMDNVQKLLSDGSSSILFKTLNKSLLGKAVYLSASIVVYIKTGRQIIYDCEGVREVLDENHLIFLSKGIYKVSDFVAADGVFTAVLFCVDDKLIEKYLSSSSGFAMRVSPLPQTSAYGTYAISANLQIQAYINSLTNVYSGGDGTAALLELKVLELLHLLAIQDTSFRFVDELSSRGKSSSHGRRSITDFMERHYSYNLRLEDYALLTGRSVSTFVRDFKRVYQTTPNQWITEKKLELGRQLLLQNNCSVTQVAADAGFENVSHFIRIYKRKYGITPRRAKALAEDSEFKAIAIF